ncbi:hypothetical protein C8F04DRAFT_1288389 [Mycena alexandri]|uniref:Uncharacterized protein n=1 Tax=Mycena alexandri TaxID=1745969 RepID=A0AAD6WYN0_9AGAR|nr:hypothetical protein C8F04DRAFT_1288389 [Mycena alexandri]
MTKGWRPDTSAELLGKSKPYPWYRNSGWMDSSLELISNVVKQHINNAVCAARQFSSPPTVKLCRLIRSTNSIESITVWLPGIIGKATEDGIAKHTQVPSKHQAVASGEKNCQQDPRSNGVLEGSRGRPVNGRSFMVELPSILILEKNGGSIREHGGRRALSTTSLGARHQYHPIIVIYQIITCTGVSKRPGINRIKDEHRFWMKAYYVLTMVKGLSYWDQSFQGVKVIPGSHSRQ